jgi:hypothetical protein
MEALEMWVRSTELHRFVVGEGWVWPALESLHFIGLSMLIGMIGVFDLRLIGFARSVPPAALHRLIPWGVGGYVVNVATGVCFFFGTPDQYMYNPAFRLKLLFMFMAGVNITFFYAAVFHKVKAMASGDAAPLSARVVGGTSLALWIGVMICGRLLTFFRPSFFH